jgi:inosine/xanthosine triphosphate pyrophosphatase family protein
MEGISERKAKFVRCLAYKGADMEDPIFFQSNNPGHISETERGTYKPYHWSRLTLIFVPEGFEKTLAEMEKEEYDSVVKKQNHFSAEEKFARWLTSKT